MDEALELSKKFVENNSDYILVKFSYGFGVYHKTELTKQFNQEDKPQVWKDGKWNII